MKPRYSRDPRMGNDPRVVIRHVYKGVTFYSSDGREMSQKQQQVIIRAAQKVPSQVWQSLAAADARVIVMNWNDQDMHPRLKELTGNVPWESTQRAFGAQTRDISFISEAGGRKFPVAVIGIGPMDKNGSGGISRDQVVSHEVAHLVDFSNRLVRRVGHSYAQLHGKELQDAVRKSTPLGNMPMNRWSGMNFGDDTGLRVPTDLSSDPKWRRTHSLAYTAGYGGLPQYQEKHQVVQYSDGSIVKLGAKDTQLAPVEVFGEALSRYWLGQKVPLKVKAFFDDYFSPRRGVDWGNAPSYRPLTTNKYETQGYQR